MKRFLHTSHGIGCLDLGQGRTGESLLRGCGQFALNIAVFFFATLGHVALSQEQAHLLNPERESDAPLPLYKSFWKILQENIAVIATIGGIALLLLLGLWLLHRLRKGKDSDGENIQRDPYDEAIEALETLNTESRRMAAKPFTFRLSEVLRVYVQRRFDLPAMELTGEEFLREATEHKFFRNYYDDLLREFIVRSDMVKYSRESIDGAGLQLLLNSAMHFVKDTHRRFEEELLMESSVSNANGS